MRSLIFFIVIFVVAGCKQTSKTPDYFDYGSIRNGVYSNDYFSFEIPIPDKWFVQNKEQITESEELNRKITEEHNTELESKLKPDNIASATLLSVFKFNIDSSNTVFNPSIGIVAENLGKNSVIKTGYDYLDYLKAQMSGPMLGNKFSPAYRSEQIGGKKFAAMDLTTHVKDMDVRQSYFALMDNDFALSIIISFGDDKEKAELEQALAKMKFR